MKLAPRLAKPATFETKQNTHETLQDLILGQIGELCSRDGVTELAVLGPPLWDDFGPESGVVFC